jgi:hypothetical protein
MKVQGVETLHLTEFSVTCRSYDRKSHSVWVEKRFPQQIYKMRNILAVGL